MSCEKSKLNPRDTNLLRQNDMPRTAKETRIPLAGLAEETGQFNRVPPGQVRAGSPPEDAPKAAASSTDQPSNNDELRAQNPKRIMSRSVEP